MPIQPPPGRPQVVVARERPGAATPGTPSRKEPKPRESSAVQDPGLKDYRLGECLGKGAFGSVYKAFNWGTGEAVAVKQIRLADLPKSELRMIETEIDLLKNLHHANIVKYIGFVKSADCLNIILEYCENGSLHSIIKAYGKFPENLVGVYMTQVLQGLQYLHDQGVIHRDIKGANILTTKDGTVKLADFGVSTSNLPGASQDKEAQVVGTPYWMAPEIIQLSGASSASDIWSVGCTVIELLQGKPPYGNLAAMPALFAIVNDDHPPLPEGISAAARDFLMQCFQKDPNLRVSARKLLRHAWIFGCRRADAQINNKTPANFSQAVEEVKQWNQALEDSKSSLRASAGPDSQGPPAARMGGGGTPARGHLTLAKPRPGSLAINKPELANDDNWDDDFASAISPSALQLKTQDNFGGLFSSEKLKAFAAVNDSRNESQAYGDDDFEGELQTIKGPNHFLDLEQEQTIRPIYKTITEKPSESSLMRAGGGGHRRTKSTMPKIQQSGAAAAAPAMKPRSPQKAAGLNISVGSGNNPLGTNKFELPARLDLAYREQSVEDYSDLFVDDDHVFDGRLVNQAVKGTAASSRQSDAPQLFHPSDLTSLPRSMQPPASSSMSKKSKKSRPSVLPDRPMRRTRSSIEIQKFAEDDDEDFSDIFGPATASIAERVDEESEMGDFVAGMGGSEVVGGEGGLMLMSKVSSNSWLGDDEDEDEDPFASMDPGWDEMDLEANIARDRHARLGQRVEELVGGMKSSEEEGLLAELSEELLVLLWENVEVKSLIISAHGLLPILEILERCTVKSRQYMILQLLKVVNAIILNDTEIQENLCFVGGIPIITKFAARQYPDETRLEAAAFVRQMYQTSTLTLQMFVSAGGLNVLVEFLDEDYDMSRDLVLIGVNGIWNVFELQGPTPKNDFCRIFSRSKILYPLALVLHRVLAEDGDREEGEEKEELDELIEGRIVNIFYLFSQAENYVKEMVADRSVLKSVLKDLTKMTPLHQVTMLKFIKNLSMLSTTILALHSADAIDCLIDLLSHSMRKGHSHFREISNQVLNTLFNLCRLSKERQEDAAVGGIIPLLLKIMRTDRPPKEFALPILCDMAHSGAKGRRYLWQNKGLDFYVSLLTDQYWQVTALDAILVWLQEETANVESHLIAGGKFTAGIVSCFNTNRVNAFDSNLLEPLLKLLRLSPTLASTLARPELFSGLGQRLSHKKPVVRLNLLRLVRIIMDACGGDSSLGMGDGLRTLNTQQVRTLMDTIQSLADNDSAVLVRNLATELLKSHHPATKTPVLSEWQPQPPTSSASSSISSRRRTGRRNTSFTPPGLQPSFSTPQTPTHRTRASLAGNNHHHHLGLGLGREALGGRADAYIEVAASARDSGFAGGGGMSPRRSAYLLEREHSAPASNVYRPLSRDGGGVTGIPRRVSGDSTASNASSSSHASRFLPPTVERGGVLPPGKGAGGSRLPRTPTTVVRSDSGASNKENYSRPVSSGGPQGGLYHQNTGGMQRGMFSREGLTSRESLHHPTSSRESLHRATSSRESLHHPTSSRESLLSNRENLRLEREDSATSSGGPARIREGRERSGDLLSGNGGRRRVRGVEREMKWA